MVLLGFLIGRQRRHFLAYWYELMRCIKGVTAAVKEYLFWVLSESCFQIDQKQQRLETMAGVCDNLVSSAYEKETRGQENAQSFGVSMELLARLECAGNAETAAECFAGRARCEQSGWRRNE